MAEDAGGFGFLKSLRRAEFWVFGSLLITFLVIAGVLIFGDGPALWARVREISLSVIMVMLALSLVNYVLRGLRWQIYSRAVGLNLPFGRNLLYYFTGFAMTVTPGKLGEALRLWLMNKGHGIRYERTAGLLIADRVNDAGALLFMAALGVSVFSDHLLGAAVTGGLILAVTLLILRPDLLLVLVNIIHILSGRKRHRLFARCRQIVGTLRTLADWRVYGGTLILAIIGWLSEALALYLLLLHLGAEITLLQSAFVFAFAMLVGATIMVPGGLGGTEIGMIGLLGALGVDFDTAFVATAVIRVTTLWFAVALGFLLLVPALKRAGIKLSLQRKGEH